MDASNIKASFKNMTIVSAVIFISGSVISLLLFIFTVWKHKTYKLDFCSSLECTKNFHEIFGLAATIFESSLSLSVTVFTVSGIYFAVQNYVNTAQSNAITNHLMNLNTFKNFINNEIERKIRINKSSIDSFKWYNLIFPNSKRGSLDIGKEYLQHINELNKVISDSNELHSKGSTPSFEYLPHQTRMKEALYRIGLSIEHMPRNDFKESEREILELIETTNKEFCNGEILESIAEQKYL